MIGLSLNFHPFDPNKPFNSLKTIDLIPNICLSSKQPREVDVYSIFKNTSQTICELINRKAESNLPYILKIKFKAQKLDLSFVSQTFYFTINNVYEDTFRYVGKSEERNPEKKLFLNTFLEANRGSREAQYFLSTMYEEGRGVKRDINEAGRYYCLSILMHNTSLDFILNKVLA